jgi:type I restriction enzyme R subunit
LEHDFVGTMRLLRDPGFQELLVNYPRAKRLFVVAVEAEDTVSSNQLIRDAAGNEHKPGDYLTAFAKFIRDNEDEVEAIGILLNRPQAWRTGTLFELHRKLRESRFQFTEDNLQKAHAAHYGKALVDIISMVSSTPPMSNNRCSPLRSASNGRWLRSWLRNPSATSSESG